MRHASEQTDRWTCRHEEIAILRSPPGGAVKNVRINTRISTVPFAGFVRVPVDAP